MWIRFAFITSITAGLVAAADIHGTINIGKKLTHHNVTPVLGIYQRGVAVELGAEESDPLTYERSHVAVYLENAPAESGSAVKLAIEQHDRRFVPDMVVIPAGATVSFPNLDPIFHNVFSLSKAKSFDLGNFPKGQTRIVNFAKPGVVAVYCHLHSNMNATVVVTPNRWGTRVDGSGVFALKDVPPGTYTVVAWHKTAGTFRKTVTIGAGSDASIDFTLPYVEPGELPGAAARTTGQR